MKKITLTFVLLFTLILSVHAQNDSIPQTIEQQKAAMKVATEWSSMLYNSDSIESLLKISKIPFALDNKKIIDSKDELKEIYMSILEDKARVKLTNIDSEIYGYKYEIIDEFIPINVLHVMLTITENDKERSDQIVLSVEISGDDFKVIGLRD